MSRHNRRPVRAAMQQALPIEKRNIAVVQLIVVTGQASLLENRRDALIEETGTISWRSERGKHGEQQRGVAPHYGFMPMPN